MTSKEMLKRLLCMAKKGCKVDMCNVKYAENASDIIKKDLDRLEKLEKFIEILKDKANIYCSLSNIACPYYILINPHNAGYEHSVTNRSYIYFDNKEDVELIKEVLEND